MSVCSLCEENNIMQPVLALDCALKFLVRKQGHESRLLKPEDLYLPSDIEWYKPLAVASLSICFFLRKSFEY